MSDKTLGHLRVIECASGIAGPFCARLLADLGADVIKIERPGLGDRARQVGPFPQDKPTPESSGTFFYFNHNKRSVTLDLASPTGREILRELVKKSDILVEDLGQAQMEAWELAYAHLERLNPGLVMTSITPFGSYGPYKDFKADELIIQALSGVMSGLGRPDKEPLAIGVPLSMLFAGLSAAVGSLLANYHKQMTGVGQLVEINMTEAFLMSTNLTRFLPAEFGATIPGRTDWGGILGSIECKDGYVGLNPLTHAHWETFAHWLGLPELLEMPIFTDLAARLQHRAEIRAMFREKVKDREREELFREGQTLRVPVSPIATVEDILGYDHFRERDFFIQVEHPILGKVTQPGRPFLMSDAAWAVRSPAPLLGEANGLVYSGLLGYSQQDIVKLRQQGVI